MLNRWVLRISFITILNIVTSTLVMARGNNQIKTACVLGNLYIEMNFVSQVDMVSPGHDGHNWVYMYDAMGTYLGLSYFNKIKTPDVSHSVAQWVQYESKSIENINFYEAIGLTFAQFQNKADNQWYYVFPVNNELWNGIDEEARSYVTFGQNVILIPDYKCGSNNLKSGLRTFFDLFAPLIPI